MELVASKQVRVWDERYTCRGNCHQDIDIRLPKHQHEAIRHPAPIFQTWVEI